VEEARKIVELGAEKVAFSAAAIKNINLLKEVGDIIGEIKDGEAAFFE
jgi:imidazole glycerol phosphate synthase subunit HisF